MPGTAPLPTVLPVIILTPNSCKMSGSPGKPSIGFFLFKETKDRCPNHDEQLISILIKLWNRLYFVQPQEGVNQNPEENSRQSKLARCGFIGSVKGCTYGAPAPVTASLMPAPASHSKHARKDPKQSIGVCRYRLSGPETKLLSTHQAWKARAQAKVTVNSA